MVWRSVLAAVALAGPVAAWETPESLYYTGKGTVALIAEGSVRADGTRFACAGCHGADGRGSGEGATLIPAVTWGALTVPTAERPAYDTARFAEAVRNGIGPDGQPLSAAMPRYEMDEAAMAGLVDSLKSLEAIDRKAFGPREVRVRIAVDDPRAGGFADAARAFNAAGGAYGRGIVVVAQGDAVALDDIAGPARQRAAEVVEALLFDRITADGHLRIRWLTGLAPEERDFRLRQRGLVHHDSARIVLWTSPDAAPPLVETVDTVYVDLAAAAPVLRALLEQSVTIHIVAPEAGLLEAALRDPSPLDYVEGYLAGLAMGQALTEIGRAAGEGALQRALAESRSALPVSVHRIGD